MRGARKMRALRPHHRHLHHRRYHRAVAAHRPRHRLAVLRQMHRRHHLRPVDLRLTHHSLLHRRRTNGACRGIAEVRCPCTSEK